MLKYTYPRYLSSFKTWTEARGSSLGNCPLRSESWKHKPCNPLTPLKLLFAVDTTTISLSFLGKRPLQLKVYVPTRAAVLGRFRPNSPSQTRSVYPLLSGLLSTLRLTKLVAVRRVSEVRSVTLGFITGRKSRSATHRKLLKDGVWTSGQLSLEQYPNANLIPLLPTPSITYSLYYLLPVRPFPGWRWAFLGGLSVPHALGVVGLFGVPKTYPLTLLGLTQLLASKVLYNEVTTLTTAGSGWICFPKSQPNFRLIPKHLPRINSRINREGYWAKITYSLYYLLPLLPRQVTTLFPVYKLPIQTRRYYQPQLADLKTNRPSNYNCYTHSYLQSWRTMATVTIAKRPELLKPYSCMVNTEWLPNPNYPTTACGRDSSPPITYSPLLPTPLYYLLPLLPTPSITYSLPKWTQWDVGTPTPVTLNIALIYSNLLLKLNTSFRYQLLTYPTKLLKILGSYSHPLVIGSTPTPNSHWEFQDDVHYLRRLFYCFFYDRKRSLDNSLLFLSTFLVQFIELISGKQVELKIHLNIREYNSPTDNISIAWLIGIMRPLKYRLGTGFFYAEAAEVVYLTFKNRDLEMFFYWLRRTVLKTKFWMHRRMFLFCKFSFENYMSRYFTNLSVCGFFMSVRGKISVGGNMRSRVLKVRRGRTSGSLYDSSVHEFVGQINTHTGVLGLKFRMFTV